MSNRRRIMWNGTVRALPLEAQIETTVIAGCEALTVTPSDYLKWLSGSVTTSDIKSMAADGGIRITHLDPFVRWVENWKPDLPIDDFPTDPIAFDADDFFVWPAPSKWSRSRPGRVSRPVTTNCPN